MSARIVSFAGCSVALAVHGAALDALSERLFGRVPAGAAEPHAALSLHQGTGSVVAVEGPERHRFPDPGSAMEWAMGRVLYHLADRASGGPLIHAAAVGPAQGAVLVGGASGAGKSCLSAWLVAAGLAYRTDEAVSADPEGRLHPFPRPFNLKAASWPAVRALASGDEDDLVWEAGRMVDPARFGPVGPPEPLRLGAAVFPTFDAGAAEARWTELSPARTAQRLVGCTVNARNLAGGGVAAAVALARGARGWQLEYGGFDQLQRDEVIARLSG